ncbi:MAG: YdcF family protein [Pseudomonadota bacterium]
MKQMTTDTLDTPGTTPKQDAAPKKRGVITRSAIGLTSFVWVALVLALFAGVAFAVGGFLKFTYDASQMTAHKANEPVIMDADGIVVLTGGADRIKQAVALMQQNGDQRLLITGVNPQTDLDAIARTNDLDDAVLTCCVDIDRTALDTIGNAKAASLWVEEKQYSSLVVVTSNLHMRRSMLEFSRAMPGMNLIAEPVEIYDLSGLNWAQKPEVWRALLTEYGKFLAAKARPYLGDELVRWAAHSVGSGITA